MITLGGSTGNSKSNNRSRSPRPFLSRGAEPSHLSQLTNIRRHSRLRRCRTDQGVPLTAARMTIAQRWQSESICLAVYRGYRYVRLPARGSVRNRFLDTESNCLFLLRSLTTWAFFTHCTMSERSDLSVTESDRFFTFFGLIIRFRFTTMVDRNQRGDPKAAP